MLEDFVVNVVKGQALHVPTGHLFYFIEKHIIDAVTVTACRGNPAHRPSLDELREEAAQAIRAALVRERGAVNFWR